MTRNGKLKDDLFEGSTINTPSMLCLQDYLDALDWVESVGGVAGTIARSNANAAVIADWVARTALGRFSRARARDALQYLALPQDRGPRGAGAAARHARRVSRAASRRCSMSEDVAKDIASLSLLAAGLAHLDRRHGGEERSRGAYCPGSIGLSPRRSGIWPRRRERRPPIVAVSARLEGRLRSASG